MSLNALSIKLKVNRKKLKNIVEYLGIQKKDYDNEDEEKILSFLKEHPNTKSFFYKQTCLAKYGVENPLQLKQNREKTLIASNSEEVKEKRKQTCLAKYGGNSPMCSKEVSKKSSERRNAKQAALTAKQTFLAKYGVENPMQSEEVKSKVKQTCLAKYGVDSYSKTNEFKKVVKNIDRSLFFNKVVSTSIEKYGCFPPINSKELKSKTYHKFKFDDLFFDSSWELAYYIYCKDNNKNIKREPKVLFFEKEGKLKQYFPDFEVDGELVEIKGDHFFNSSGELINPYTKKVNKEKYQCMIDNKVKIIRGKEIDFFLKYAIMKYGKDFLDKWRIK